VPYARREYPFFNAPESVGKVRFCLRSTLLAWEYDNDVVDAALLIASELATNAVRHSNSSVFILVCQLDTGFLTIGVIDYDDQLPKPQPIHQCSENGRGLQVVATLADDYGVLPHEHGKFVYGRLHVTAPPLYVQVHEQARVSQPPCFT
jgi:anti-sigma regulatory factor (Ser/Thr protein kinase)